MENIDREHTPDLPERPDEPTPEGMTASQVQDLVTLMLQGMEADEEARVERELYPAGVSNKLERDEVLTELEHRHGDHQSMRWGLMMLFSVLLGIAAGATWAFTRGGAGDDGADERAAEQPVNEAPAADASSDAGRDEAGSAAEPAAVVPEAASADAGPAGDAPTTTTFVAPTELVGSWICTDGDFGYEFRADGTYTFTSLDSRIDGRYSVSTGPDGGSVNLLDPSDPSGLTAAMIVPYRADGGSLWLTLLGADTQMIPGTMPAPGSTAAPIGDLSAAAATTLLGRVEAGQPATLPGAVTYVSQTLDVPTATGSITIDAVAGVVEGRYEVAYACSPERCDEPNETASAQVVIDVVDTRPSTYMQDTWAYEGSAHVRVLLDATTPQASEVVTWSWVGEYDTTYYVGLEREWAVFDLTLRLPDDDEVVTLQIIGPLA